MFTKLEVKKVIALSIIGCLLFSSCSSKKKNDPIGRGQHKNVVAEKNNNKSAETEESFEKVTGTLVQSEEGDYELELLDGVKIKGSEFTLEDGTKVAVGVKIEDATIVVRNARREYAEGGLIGWIRDTYHSPNHFVSLPSIAAAALFSASFNKERDLLTGTGVFLSSLTGTAVRTLTGLAISLISIPIWGSGFTTWKTWKRVLSGTALGGFNGFVTGVAILPGVEKMKK